MFHKGSFPEKILPLLFNSPKLASVKLYVDINNFLYIESIINEFICSLIPAFIKKTNTRNFLQFVSLPSCFRRKKMHLRRAVDIIDAVNRLDVDALMLSLDAEKAFGRLSWPFLFATLEQMGVRGPFLRDISALYSSPMLNAEGVKLPSHLKAIYH